jgi:phosphopantetheinyl transferase (holo-ACP synthase)
MNRSQRRLQLKSAGMLRVKNMYGPFTEVGKLWYAKTAKEGAKLHLQNVEANEKRQSEYFAQKEASIKASHEANGYSAEKVEVLLEAWRCTIVKDKETYRADRKESIALYQKAAQMK